MCARQQEWAGVGKFAEHAAIRARKTDERADSLPMAGKSPASGSKQPKAPKLENDQGPKVVRRSARAVVADKRTRGKQP